jgi:hypothetical protein
LKKISSHCKLSCLPVVCVQKVAHCPALPMAQRFFLPVSVYSYDRRSKRYRLKACLQCSVDGPPLPRVLTCGAGLGLMGENVELLKSVMRAPAVVLTNGTRTVAYDASCEEIVTPLPPTSPMKLLRAYELSHVNLNTLIAHYRLRADGALVLANTERLHCTMCHVPDEMDLGYVRHHLECRALAIRKLLRDRRLVVQRSSDEQPSVFSFETLQRSESLFHRRMYKSQNGSQEAETRDGLH